jgi:NADH-quinone oxidoreductase subunit M
MTQARFLAFLFALAAALWLAPLGVCHAQARPPKAAAGHGIISLSVPGSPEGPVQLAPKDGGWLGEFAVRNTGDGPLAISRIALRGDEDDVRAPAKMAVHFVEGGGTAITVPPGGTRKVVVTWTPEKDPRVHQAFAHVVVTSSDEAAGEVAMGVHGQLPRGVSAITDHALSWLVFLPLVAAALAIAMQLGGRADDALLRKVAIGVTAAQCVLAAWACDAFNADVTRIDGNDGYQLIERVVWIRSLGVEYFVGVDGASMPMILLTSVLGLVGTLAAGGVEQRVKGFYAFYMILLTGIMGVFVSLDLVLFFVFWQVVLVPLYFLIGVWGAENREQAAAKAFVFTLVGSGLMLLAILALYANADRTFLVDGTTVTHTFAIPELMRVAFHAKHLTLLGMPLVKVAWVCLFLSFAVVLPMFPLHRWLPDALVTSPTPVALVLVGLVMKLGAYGIVRVCFGVLPEASRWAAGTVIALGVVNVVYGALCAMAQTDLKRMYAYAAMSHMGFCLIGLGSLTPQGIAACIVQMATSGVLGALMILLLGALAERLKTRELGRMGGLGREVPAFAALLGFSLFASLGLPGLAGFWGELLALFGAFPLHRVLTLVGALGAAITAAYHVSTLHKLVLGSVDDELRKGPALAPFGGKIPEITPRELAMIAPLAVIALLLGVWPVPLLSLIAGGVRDLTALVNPPGPDQIAQLFP